MEGLGLWVDFVFGDCAGAAVDKEFELRLLEVVVAVLPVGIEVCVVGNDVFDEVEEMEFTLSLFAVLGGKLLESVTDSLVFKTVLLVTELFPMGLHELELVDDGLDDCGEDIT